MEHTPGAYACDVNPVTKSFYAFILDRNKYTHRESMYWYPNKETLLEYENEARRTEYGIVNTEVLNSFLSCYKSLNELLTEIDRKLIPGSNKELPELFITHYFI
jgi:hypothetical protein